MAESTSVIREFLVALGYKPDDAGLKKFVSGIETATKAVFGLATAIETTALAVAVGVTRYASNLEKLYFASIKTGASAANLRAFDKAAQNFGTSAGEALNSIQGIARFMRENPGGEGLIASLGVQTREANGQLKDTAELMLGLGTKLQGMPYYLAKQYADIFGISEDTLRAVINGDFEAEYRRFQQRMQDPVFAKATADAHDFMDAWRELTAELEVFGVQVVDALQNKFGWSIRDVTEYLTKNGPKLAKRVAEIANEIVDWAIKIGNFVGRVIDLFIRWDKATDGWSTRLLVFAGILRYLGGWEIISGIWKLGGVFLRLGNGIVASVAGANGLLGLAGKLGLIGAAGAGGYWLGGKIFENLSEDTQNTIGSTVAKVLASLGSKTAQESLAVNDPLYFLMHGNGRWTREQALGILANFQAESGMNPAAVGDHGQAYGIGQWHKDRQEAFARLFGHDIHGSSLAEQLQFADYELSRGAFKAVGNLLKAQKSQQAATYLIAHDYEIPSNRDVVAADRAARTVQLTAQTDIHVHGVSDPIQAGKTAADEQARANAELARNLQPLVQ